MTTDVSTAGRHPRAGRVTLLAGLGLVAVAALLLMLTGGTGIRYSADHDGTVPTWHRWIPALAGIVLIRLIPPAPDPRWPDPVAPYREAVPPLLAGVALAAVSSPVIKEFVSPNGLGRDTNSLITGACGPGGGRRRGPAPLGPEAWPLFETVWYALA
ncbi:hypothetical protein AB0B20_28625, partial [Micromonospora sp. NPDC049151]